MPQFNISLDDKHNRILNIYKSLKYYRSKERAIVDLIENYAVQYINKELK